MSAISGISDGRAALQFLPQGATQYLPNIGFRQLGPEKYVFGNLVTGERLSAMPDQLGSSQRRVFTHDK
jgi:hypothetical protein